MYKALLIWRYFKKKRIAYIAIAAVMLLVMMMIIVLSIMSGLLSQARRNNYDLTGDIIISRESLVGFPYYLEFLAQLGPLPEVAAATPLVSSFGLLNSAEPVQIFGVHLADFCRVTNFCSKLNYQKNRTDPDFVLAAVEDVLTPEQRQRGVIMCLDPADREYLAHRAANGRVQEKVPLSFTLFAISGRGTLTGSETGETQIFWYVDDAITRLVDMDNSAFFVDFEQLQRLAWMDGRDGSPARANEIRVRLAAGVRLEPGRQAIAGLWEKFVQEKTRAGAPLANLLQDVQVQTWQQFRRANIAPMEKEKNLMIMIFGFIGIVAVFIIVAIFFLIVTEKIKDLGIIKSVGASGWNLSQIFLGYGALVGAVGAGLGWILGVLIVTNANRIEDVLYKLFEFRLWPPDIYAIDKIPDQVDYFQAGLIGLAAIIASILGAALPARRAAKLDVIAALRVE